MLVLDRVAGGYEDRQFSELPGLLRGDELIVVNNARVIPARLFGHREGVRADRPGKSATQRHFLQSKIEVLLVHRLTGDQWEALVKPGRKIRVGERLAF